jgi:hypothetical protein
MGRNCNRREFLEIFGLATLAGAVLSACGFEKSKVSSDTTTTTTTGLSSGGPSTCETVGTNSSIGANHGHTLTVPKEDVIAGVQSNYDITGAAGHAHTVQVTAAHFTTLKAGNSVSTTTLSDSSGHSHGVTISCA